MWPSGVAAETGWGAIATPLRIVNLNPFHLLYGVPGSFGSRVVTPGSSELIASMDMASYLSAANAGTERVLIDGETYRQRQMTLTSPKSLPPVKATRVPSGRCAEVSRSLRARR